MSINIHRDVGIPMLKLQIQKDVKTIVEKELGRVPTYDESLLYEKIMGHGVYLAAQYIQQNANL